MCLPLLHFRIGKLNQVKSNISVCWEVKLLFVFLGRVCGNTLPQANTAVSPSLRLLHCKPARRGAMFFSVHRCIKKRLVVNTNCWALRVPCVWVCEKWGSRQGGELLGHDPMRHTRSRAGWGLEWFTDTLMAAGGPEHVAPATEYHFFFVLFWGLRLLSSSSWSKMHGCWIKGHFWC